jgi:hypothetical protein
VLALSLSFWFGVGACGSQPSAPQPSGASSADSQSVILIPEGNLRNEGFGPAKVKFAFVDERGDDLPDTPKELAVQYDHTNAAGLQTNSAVVIPVPSDGPRVLAYRLGMTRLNRAAFEVPIDFDSETRYLEVDGQTGGHLVDLPVSEFVTSPNDPFPKCFDVNITNKFVGKGMDDGGPFSFFATEVIDFNSRVSKIFYGFTTMSSTEFCGSLQEGDTHCQLHPDVAFHDGAGTATAEGVIQPTLFREAFNNMSAGILIRVPDGQNIVYRLEFESDCAGGQQGQSQLFYRVGSGF